MRFKQFLLTEMLDRDELMNMNDLIHDYCKPYLKLIKGKNPLYRGMDYRTAEWGNVWIGQKGVRSNRKPKGTQQFYFNKFNQWLEQNGHNRRDNTMICTSDKEWAEGFGGHGVYYVFPYGKISYTFVESMDININDETTGWTPYTIENFFEIENFDESDFKLNKPFADYFHTDEKFDLAYKKNYEIWFKCKSYYYVIASQPNYIKWDKNKQVFV